MKQLMLNSVNTLDLVVWLLVLAFFCGSSLFFHGNVQLSFIGACGIIVEMMIIGLSIEIIIESIKHIKGIGTITGFITNGPEALCLIAGLAVGDVLFAASTPLGSNFINPILLLTAAIICGRTLQTFKTRPIYSLITILSTASLAIGFYLLDKSLYPFWLLAALLVTIPLFFFRPTEGEEESDEMYHPEARAWFFPAIILLCGAGFFLDPVVSFAAEHSKTPKGVIGFLVLATLTSWPEFKSCLALLSRNKPLAAILNITVSNITNIWLAASGVGFYLWAK
ncbi:MAG: sodium:proton exchanger [Proteobacteria bacterium]|nr:sodium:proton exchanger [Pseudomonadota bacterium]MBU1058868.1 sodium:proton exchanger [Pseudomonadota bacterium]